MLCQRRQPALQGRVYLGGTEIYHHTADKRRVFRNLQLDCKVCLQWFWIMEVDILLTILAAPLFIVYRTKRILGYSIFTMAIVISMIASYAILESQNILFEPLV